jgi:putative membrane protein
MKRCYFYFMKFLIRYAITVLALVVATFIIPGIRIADTNAWIAFAVVALILGFLNTIVKPVLELLSIGFIIVTLGIFLLIINAFTLWLSAVIAQAFGIGFYVEGFWAAFWGSIIVSVVSWLLSTFIYD